MNSTDFSGQLLDFLRSRARDADQLVDLRYLPPRKPTFCDWPTFVDPRVKAAVTRVHEQNREKVGEDNVGLARDRVTGVAGDLSLGTSTDASVSAVADWKLWSHQGEALEALHAGHDVFLSTGTGSGKSLVAWISALTAIASLEPGGGGTRVGAKTPLATQSGAFSSLFIPTTLYMAPTKALVADQFQQIQKLAAALPFDVPVAVVDGDASPEAKDWARSFSQILLTNPDYVHHVILAGHQRWARFLRALRYVVVDEMHYWRGVPGAHLALVLRRLLRVCARLGARPQVIMLSATVQNPLEVAEKMTGRQDAVVVECDGSGFPGRHVVIWQPQVDTQKAVAGDSYGDYVDSPSGSGQARVSAAVEAAMLMAGLVECGARVLTFVRSRSATESVSMQVRDRLALSGKSGAEVLAYRGGYLPEERRALERALHSGEISGLVTTNALELGIDIAGLDATVTLGWPGSKASLWQQFGRCGRGQNPGVSVFIASNDPLDAYFAAHCDELFGLVESQVFEPKNPWVLFPHLCAAAAEFPLTVDDMAIFDLPDERFLQKLVEGGYLRVRAEDWYWNVGLAVDPHRLTDLRGGGGQVQIVEQSSGAIVGTIARERADLEVFPNAIYLHQGQTYRVLELVQDSGWELGWNLGPGFGQGFGLGFSGDFSQSFVPEQRLVLVERVHTLLRTRAGQSTQVEILDEEEQRQSADGCMSWHFGPVQVASRVTDYDLWQIPDAEWVANYSLDLPVRKLVTTAVWFELTSLGHAALGVADSDLLGTLHAVEHALIGVLPLLATCDRWDLGGLSVSAHPQTGAPTVFIHDAYRGGAGFTQTGFRRAGEWLQRTLQTVQGCACLAGCPACIHSPKCGNRNEPLFKTGAIRLLEFLVERTPRMSNTLWS